MESARALCEFNDLGLVRVAGPDCFSWLTTLSSQILTGMTAGESREMLLLDPQGRIQFACGVVAGEGEVYLLLEGGKVPALVDFLTKMQFMLRVEVTDVSADFAVFATIVPQGKFSTVINNLATLPGVFGQWEDPWPGVVEGGTTYTPVGFKHPALERKRVFVLVSAGEAESFTHAWVSSVFSAGDCPWAGRNAWEALRIEDMRPDYLHEVDDKSLPHELDWLRTAVHLNKGCYCGQEAVARIVNLGKPPRRLVVLQLDGSNSVQIKVGAPVLAGKRSVGAVTSIARHADLGPVALAVVRRGLALEAPLTVVQGEDEVPALQEVVVDLEGKSSASPAQRPGAELRGLNLRERQV